MDATRRDDTAASSGERTVSTHDAMHRTAQGQLLPQSGGARSEPGPWSVTAMAIGMPSMTMVVIDAPASDAPMAVAATGPEVWTASRPTTARIERHREMRGPMVTDRIMPRKPSLAKGASGDAGPGEVVAAMPRPAPTPSVRCGFCHSRGPLGAASSHSLEHGANRRDT